MNSTHPNTPPNTQLNSQLDTQLAQARSATWRGTPPPLHTLQTATSARNKRTTPQRALALSLIGLTTTGLAFGGYHLASRSWTASVKVEGKDVQVIYNGQPVPPDQVEWLENGHCLITINGARILLDPTQPGGASASISVTESPTPSDTP